MSPPLVAAVAYDGLCTFEFGCVVELFSLHRPELGVPWYRFGICAAEKVPLHAAGGFMVTVPYTLSLLDRADSSNRPVGDSERICNRRRMA
jgi:AraC family transcriptional activator FtrA